MRKWEKNNEQDIWYYKPNPALTMAIERDKNILHKDGSSEERIDFYGYIILTVLNRNLTFWFDEDSEKTRFDSFEKIETYMFKRTKKILEEIRTVTGSLWFQI